MLGFILHPNLPGLHTAQWPKATPYRLRPTEYDLRELFEWLPVYPTVPINVIVVEVDRFQYDQRNQL